MSEVLWRFKNILPPVLFLEKAPITASADTYEASILLLKLVTGDYPYHAEPGLVNPGRRDNVYEKHVEGNFAMPENVPEEIKGILKKGIKGIPKERYQTADDMLGDLLEAYKKLP
jgi:serine/threonine protein kinase